MYFIKRSKTENMRFIQFYPYILHPGLENKSKLPLSKIINRADFINQRRLAKSFSDKQEE